MPITSQNLKKAITTIVNENKDTLLDAFYHDKKIREHLNLNENVAENEVLSCVIDDLSDAEVLKYVNDNMDNVFICEYGEGTDGYTFFEAIKHDEATTVHFDITKFYFTIFDEKAVKVGETIDGGGGIIGTTYVYNESTYITETGEVVIVDEISYYAGDDEKPLYALRKKRNSQSTPLLDIVVDNVKPVYVEIFEL